MRAFVYQNTKSIPHTWHDVHKTQKRGMAYETDSHFVHVYGSDERLWTVSPGLTITEGRDGELRNWILKHFGAKEIEVSEHEVGTVVRGVWRPGIFDSEQMLRALGATNAELRRSEQALFLLVQRMEELLIYIEPTEKSLSTYGHKSRELLILSCTEAEAQWAHYLQLARRVVPKAGFNTNDYVDVCKPLYLPEFIVSLPRYNDLEARPFKEWSKAGGGPTKTLPWYSAYNKTKHNRTVHFEEATLQRCIESVAANLILFAVRFGPYRLYQSAGNLSAYVNTTFNMRLADCKPTSFYVPRLEVDRRSAALTWGHAGVMPWHAQPFAV